jgi:hypothetical protein
MRATLCPQLGQVFTQREFERLAKVVAPLETDVVVVGDADFGSCVRGLPPGVSGKFVKALTHTLEPHRVVFADEFRSSCLDSVSHTRMFHPVRGLGVSRSGTRYIKRVFGVYQSTGADFTRTLDRDCNAARNIVQNFRYLLTHGRMPAAFQRSVEPTKPPSCSYRYHWREGKEKFSRWLEAADIAPDGDGLAKE